MFKMETTYKHIMDTLDSKEAKDAIAQEFHKEIQEGKKIALMDMCSGAHIPFKLKMVIMPLGNDCPDIQMAIMRSSRYMGARMCLIALDTVQNVDVHISTPIKGVCSDIFDCWQHQTIDEKKFYERRKARLFEMLNDIKTGRTPYLDVDHVLKGISIISAPVFEPIHLTFVHHHLYQGYIHQNILEQGRIEAQIHNLVDEYFLLSGVFKTIFEGIES